MLAMDNATKACNDMIENLTLAYNKARQAAITAELMDIVGGAEALKGQKPTPEAIRAAAEASAAKDIDPGSDIHASADYRRQLSRVLAQRTLTQAFDRAKGG